MHEVKTKALAGIEEKMESLDKNSLRYQVLDCARRFKTTWIDFGQYLHAVWSNKNYRDWGFLSFEGYCAKELGIKQATASKLIKSYHFLQKEEPRFIREEPFKDSKVRSIPSLEAVNVLRLAKQKKEIDKPSYDSLRRDVLVDGRNYKEVNKTFKGMIAEARNIDPQEEREKRRASTIRRLVSNIRMLEKELEMAGMLNRSLSKDINGIIEKLETTIKDG